MNNNFLKSAKKTLNDIFEYTDNLDNDIEVDYEDHNITIELQDNKIFIISIHEPSNQIWLSSPLSGAHHFSLTFKENEIVWISTRNKEIFLIELLHDELNEILKKNE